MDGVNTTSILRFNNGTINVFQCVLQISPYQAC